MLMRTWIRMLLARRVRRIARTDSPRFRPVLQLLEDRCMPSLGSPTWVAQGPGPIVNGGVQGMTAQQNPVDGAVNDVAFGANNSLLAATANGGIWISPDAFTTVNGTLVASASPTWMPVAQQLPALAISDIESTPATPTIVYAGTGSLSSNQGKGGLAVGVMQSIDGGQTWNLVAGDAQLPVQQPGQPAPGADLVRAVVPEALAAGQTTAANQVVLAGMSVNGLYRSTNGGAAFVQVSGNMTSNLPAGGIFSLIADPNNANRLYVAVRGAAPTDTGVYRSDDQGATWTRIDNNGGANNTGITGLPNADNIQLAITKDANNNPVLYAGLDSGGKVAGVFRTASAAPATGTAVTWTAMDLPGITLQSPTGTVFTGATPGGQGTSNFRLAADPINPNLVYLSGDRQPAGNEANPNLAQFPNPIGANDYGASVFVGDASQPQGMNATTGLSNQWTPLVANYANGGNAITANAANGSMPHADSRFLLPVGKGLVLTCDGGIYSLSNRAASQGLWTSLNGNLAATEITGISYDPVNHIIVEGAQDNGTAVQQSAGSLAWRGVLSGDGGYNQVSISGSPATATYYYTSQNMSLSSVQVNAAGPIANSTVGLNFFTQPPNLTAGDRPQFYQPFILRQASAATGNLVRILTGTNQNLYESLDGGNSWQLLSPTPVGTVTALAYGPLNPAANQDVAVVGTANGLLMRTTPGATFQAVAGYPAAAGAPQSIVLDPSNPTTGYVLGSNNHIYRMTNASTPAAATFTDITAGLVDVNNLNTQNNNLPANLVTLAFIAATAGAPNGTVFVGGLGGVYASDNPAATTPTWAKFGAGMPQVLVDSLVYDSTTNQLIDGTLGRGAWSIANISAFIGQPANPTPNQPPVINAPAAALTTGGVTRVVFTAANANAISIADPDAGNNFEKVDLAVTGGTIALATTAGLDVQMQDPGGKRLIFAGTLANLNAALNGLTFTPVNQTSMQMLTIRVDDQGSSGSGGAQKAAATVTINVNLENDAPVNTLPGTQFLKPGATLSFGAATGNVLAVADGDAGATPIRTTLSVDNGTLAVDPNAAGGVGAAGITGNSSGTVVLNGPQAQINATLASLVYTPPATFTGTAKLTVTTNDLGQTSPDSTTNNPKSTTSILTIMVTANDAPPVIVAPTSLTTGQGTNLPLAGNNAFTVFDSDIGTGLGSLSVAVSQGTLLFNGQAFQGGIVFNSISLAGANQVPAALVYQPPANFNGPVTLTITFNDNQGTLPNGPQTTVKTVLIQVGAPPAPPAVAAPAASVVTTGSSDTFSTAAGDPITIAADDPLAVDVEVTLSADHGTLSLGETDGLSFSEGSGQGTAIMTFDGDPSDINDALNTLQYVADPGFAGTDDIAVTVANPDGDVDRSDNLTNNVVDDDGGIGGDAVSSNGPGAAGTLVSYVNPPAANNPLSLDSTQVITVDVLPSAFAYDAATKTLTVTCSAALPNFQFSQATTLNAGVTSSTYTFVLSDNASPANTMTQSFPDSDLTTSPAQGQSSVVVNGVGAAGKAVLITNDNYAGPNNTLLETPERISLGSSANAGVGTVSKFVGNTITGAEYTFLSLTSFPTSYAYAGRADGTVLLYGTTGIAYNGFVSAGNYSYMGGPGLFHLAQGAPSVYGYGAGQPTDFAYHYAANAGSAFVVSGVAFSYMSCMDTVNGVTQPYFNVGVGFLENTGIAKNPGQDYAYVIDSPGNDTFVGGTTFSYMFIAGPPNPYAEFDAAYGFALVYAQSFVGGMDTDVNNNPIKNILVGFKPV